MERINATCIEIDGKGVLLRGPSGSGKSDLALRLIDTGASLVADDYTEVEVAGGRLLAAAPEPIKGLLEVRGVGVARAECPDRAELALVVDLVAADRVERLPGESFEDILGVAVRQVALAPFEASAAAKVRVALRAATGQLTLAP